jgi:Lar family restriction alleviation protein
MNMKLNDLELKPCPFCGETPKLPISRSTHYELSCDCSCAGVSVRICDLITDYYYADEYIERAKTEAAKRWNSRCDLVELWDKDLPGSKDGSNE